RTVVCLANPSGMQAARWGQPGHTTVHCGLLCAWRIRAACRPRGGASLDTQQSTADCCVPGESERHAGREVGPDRLAPKAPDQTREIRRMLDGLPDACPPLPLEFAILGSRYSFWVL